MLQLTAEIGVIAGSDLSRLVQICCANEFAPTVQHYSA
jgi:hypothetical protein